MLAALAHPGSSPPQIKLASTEPHHYPPLTFSSDPGQPVDTSTHSWGNYVLAAYKVGK